MNRRNSRARPVGAAVALLLPGILVAATGVGAGDLATAGLAGARIGVGIFWAVVFGAALKLVLNEGLARWQVATGTTLLEGWIRKLRLQWVFVLYLVLWSFFVGGALISATGVAGSAILPLGDDPVTSKRIWGILHSLLAVALVLGGGYRLFEKVMAVCVALMFLTVVYCGVRIGADLDWSRVAPVAPWRLSGEEGAWVLGLVGGVGGTLTLLSYGYWIRERGREGRAGVRACRIDLTVGYIATAFFGVAMLVIASTTPGLEGKGAELIARLGDRLGEGMGGTVRAVFLAGAWGAVFSSMLGVWQSVPYMFADFLSEARWIDRKRREALDHAGSLPYRLYVLFLALPPMVTLWWKFRTIQLLYAVLGAFFMPLLAATLLVLLNRRAFIGPDYRNGRLANAALAVIVLFFLWQGVAQLAPRIGALF